LALWARPADRGLCNYERVDLTGLGSDGTLGLALSQDFELRLPRASRRGWPIGLSSSMEALMCLRYALINGRSFAQYMLILC